MSSVDTSPSRLNRHRARMRAQGLRPVQFWVPDTRHADFAATIKAQCRALTGDKAEAEILSFTEAAATMIEGWQ